MLACTVRRTGFTGMEWKLNPHPASRKQEELRDGDDSAPAAHSLLKAAVLIATSITPAGGVRDRRPPSITSDIETAYSRSATSFQQT